MENVLRKNLSEEKNLFNEGESKMTKALVLGNRKFEIKLEKLKEKSNSNKVEKIISNKLKSKEIEKQKDKAVEILCYGHCLN